MISFHSIDYHTTTEKIKPTSRAWYKTFQRNKSIYDNDVEEREIENVTQDDYQYIIYIYGRTLEGKHVTVRVTDFFPYCYVMLPETYLSMSPKIRDRYIQEIAQEYNNKVFETSKWISDNNGENLIDYRVSLLSYQYIEKKKFVGFTNGRLFPYLCFYFTNPKAMHKYINAMKKEIRLPIRAGTQKKMVLKQYETNMNPLLRFFHKTNIEPSNWLQCDTQNIIKETETDIFMNVHWSDITRDTVSNEEGKVAPFVLASFDIETDSLHGDFPVAKKSYISVIHQCIDMFMKTKKNEHHERFISIGLQTLGSSWDKLCTSPILWSWIISEKVFEPSRLSFSRKQFDELMLSIVQNDPHIGKLDNVVDCYEQHQFSRYFTKNPKEAPESSDSEDYNSDPEREKHHRKDNWTIDNAKDIINALHKDVFSWKDEWDIHNVKNKGTQRISLDTIYTIANSLVHFFLMAEKNRNNRKESKEKKELDKQYQKMIQSLNAEWCHHLPACAGDHITQIGTVFYRLGDTNPYLWHIICLGKTDTFPEKNKVVISCDTEEEVLLEWQKIVQQQNPDMFTGYNIFGYDFQYMKDRADELGIQSTFSTLNKQTIFYPNVPSEFIKKELSSSGLGDNTLYYYNTIGRVPIDVMKVVQRDFNLDNYSLDFVSSTFMTGGIKSIKLCKVKSSKGTMLHSNKQRLCLEVKDIGYLEKDKFIQIELDKAVYVEKFLNGMKFKITSIRRQQATSIPLSTTFYPPGALGTIADSSYSSRVSSKKDKNIIYTEVPDDIIEHPEWIDEINQYGIKWMEVKDDLPYKEMFQLQRRDASGRKTVAKYCLQDCELCIRIFKKLEIYNNNSGMANVCCVPLSFIFMRGQGIKLFSLVGKFCADCDTLIPVVPRNEKNDDSYEGAIVLEPKSGIYTDPVAVMDYNSLYPSCMISENISHDSYVNDPMYDNLPGIDYVDITFDTYEYIKTEGTKAVKKIQNGTKTCRYAQLPNGEKSIIPQILMSLLKARKDTRKKIKETSDPFKKSLLDGLQLAYKVTANSLYGQVGATTSPICLKDLAASTTAVGRNNLLFARDYILQNYKNSVAVYGDTDSVFMKFETNDENGNPLTGIPAVHKSIELATEASLQISKQLKSPHNLEFEKVIYPFALISKKRYVGHYYTDFSENYYLKSMGIVLKRRDNAPIVKVVFGGVVNILMKERDVQKAMEFVKTELKNIIDGYYPIEKFIISKTLRSHYKNPEQIAHKVLADRIAKRDPGNKPKSNDRIQFAYIQVKEKKGMLQGERIETPEFIQENNLTLNYEFYITNQIMKPVLQLLEMNEPFSKKIIFEPILTELSNKKKRIRTLDMFFKMK